MSLEWLHLRISDDHDETRAVARYGFNGALAASALVFTLDGVPLLYNGMEVGDATESGDPALFEKMPVFWKPKERPPLRDIYRGGFHMIAPPNSPWAALDGDFGLEIVGNLSRIAELRKGAGTYFDPGIVSTFIQCVNGPSGSRFVQAEAAAEPS